MSNPDRFFTPRPRKGPLFHVVEDFMPEAFIEKLSTWAQMNLDRMHRGGDEHGEERFNYEITDVDTVFDGCAEFRKAIATAYPDAVPECHQPAFEFVNIETHLTMYHHGSHFAWHDDAPDYSGAFVPSRKLTFCWYVHTDPLMFQGGKLEFADGTRIAPVRNRLVFFHPLQTHRVTRVDCWSAEAKHGRWALMGWVHGRGEYDPQPGEVAEPQEACVLREAGAFERP